MKGKYFIYYEGKYYGIYTEEEIAACLREHILSINHYLYDIDLSCMFQIRELACFSQLLLKHLPNKQPDLIFIYRENTFIGPFTKDQLNALVQEHEVFPEDLSINSSDLNLIPLEEKIEFPNNYKSEFPPFVEENIYLRNNKHLFKVSSYIVRNHPRAFYVAKITIKIDSHLSYGECRDISKGGCYVKYNNANEIAVGNIIDLKITPEAIKLPIETKAEIRWIDSKKIKGFGVKFLDIDAKCVDEISEYVNKYITTVKK